MGDIFEAVNAGDKIKPSARGWNAIQRAARAFHRGEYGGGAGYKAKPETSTELLVKNTTGSTVGQFGILQVAAPLITQAASPATFYESRSLVGTSPAAAKPFVVTQEPIGDGKIGRATLLGLTPCQVNLTSTSHDYADATADTTKLTSSGRGPARILWVASDSPGPRTTGVQWALVELGASAGDETAFVTALSSTLVSGAVSCVRRPNVGRPSAWPLAESGWVQEANGVTLVAGLNYFCRRNGAELLGAPLWDTVYCCGVGGSGSGGGGCCPGVVYGDQICMSISSPGYLPLDGFGILLTGSGATRNWGAFGFTVNGCGNYGVLLICPGLWSLAWTSSGSVPIGPGPDPCASAPGILVDTGSITLVSCNPLSLTASGTATVGGVVYPITVTFSSTIAGCGGSGSGGGGGGGITTSCCPSNSIPTTLHATLTVTSGTCAALNGQVVAITYAGGGVWQGTIAGGGLTWTVTASCSGGVWEIGLSNGVHNCGVAGGTFASAACSPFSVTYTGFTVAAPCVTCGSAVLTITVTP